MTSMNRYQRAEHFLQILLSENDKSLAINKIINELNTLVYTGTNDRLSREEKLLILNELNRLLEEKRTIVLENFHEKGFSTNASNNDDILDVISAMKKRI